MNRYPYEFIGNSETFFRMTGEKAYEYLKFLGTKLMDYNLGILT